MIRRVEPSEAGQVFNLMGKVYADHSFLDQGLATYTEQLERGDYVSLGNFDDDTLLAHAGFSTGAKFALINALVVDPATRGAGLGRTIFEARINYLRSNHSFDFIVGYSMMQHLRSQRLYSDDFKPIGLDVGYPDIYHGDDSDYNLGTSANAEIVLCQRLYEADHRVDLRLPPRNRPFALQILHQLGVTCEFSNGLDDVPGTETFLGFHPDIHQGLFVPAFIDATAAVSFDSLLTSNTERQDFVDSIRESYERNSDH
jgi:GNAT superfamily N-acetyltransferase